MNLLCSALLVLQAAVPPNDPPAVVRAYLDAMRARWSYRILSERGDTITALLEEESDSFTLLGLERSVQVRSYVVRNGKVQTSFGHLFVTAKSSQAEAVQQFKSWLRATVAQPDPALIGPAGNLLLTKESAQPMIYWMGRWRAEVDAKNRR